MMTAAACVIVNIKMDRIQLCVLRILQLKQNVSTSRSHDLMLSCRALASKVCLASTLANWITALLRWIPVRCWKAFDMFGSMLHSARSRFAHAHTSKSLAVTADVINVPRDQDWWQWPLWLASQQCSAAQQRHGLQGFKTCHMPTGILFCRADKGRQCDLITAKVKEKPAKLFSNHWICPLWSKWTCVDEHFGNKKMGKLQTIF